MSYYSFENLNLLLVDDNRTMRRLLGSILRGLGAREIVEAHDGRAALDILRARQIDIALCDLLMAPMDGVAFTRAIRRDPASPNRFLPIIMTSAHSEPAKVMAARDAGVTEFLAKPLSVRTVYHRVMSVIEKPRPFVRAGDYFGPLRKGVDIVPGAAPAVRTPPVRTPPAEVEILDD